MLQSLSQCCTQGKRKAGLLALIKIKKLSMDSSVLWRFLSSSTTRYLYHQIAPSDSRQGRFYKISVYRRVGTMIFVPAESGNAATVEMVTIDPQDLQAAQERDLNHGA